MWYGQEKSLFRQYLGRFRDIFRTFAVMNRSIDGVTAGKRHFNAIFEVCLSRSHLGNALLQPDWFSPFQNRFWTLRDVLN